MISLGTEGAVLVVGVAAVVAVGWAANLSVQSALRGPAWALGRLRVAARVIGLPIGIGAVLIIAVDPVWVGLAVLYVAVMVWFLSGLLRRNLTRYELGQGFGEIPADRRAQIVTRARRFLGYAAGAIAIVGAAMWGTSPAATIVSLAMAALLALTAFRLN